MPPEVDVSNGLERIVPEILSPDDELDRGTLELHLARYEFAGDRVGGRSVVDIACGSGYGSALLARRGAASVVGVDISEAAIAYARATHSLPNVEYVCAAAEAFSPATPFDVAVSLETIEHVRDPAAFVGQLAALVRPGGLVIGSAPTTLSSDVNPYHLHDFTPTTFRALFARAGLEIVGEMTQRQKVALGPLLRRRRRDAGHFELRRGLARYYATHPMQAARRIQTLVRHGLWNEYLILAARRAA